MTREEFIKVLEDKGYSYREEGGKIVITSDNRLGSVQFDSLETLPPGVHFENRGYVYLQSLKTLPPDVEFRDRGYVSLDSLIGGWFHEWSGNIEGIESNRLLNKMIELGLFDRR
jgi:hypothetical protein